MGVKEFLRPAGFKLLVFLLVGILYLYFAGENACGAGFSFSFCYKAYGFPFLYIITGDIDAASGYVKTLPLGSNFGRSGSFLFNPGALISDIALVYLLACFISMLFRSARFKH